MKTRIENRYEITDKKIKVKNSWLSRYCGRRSSPWFWAIMEGPKSSRTFGKSSWWERINIASSDWQRRWRRRRSQKPTPMIKSLPDGSESSLVWNHKTLIINKYEGLKLVLLIERENTSIFKTIRYSSLVSLLRDLLVRSSNIRFLIVAWISRLCSPISNIRMEKSYLNLTIR